MKLAALVVALAIPSSALAQSTRYPPLPADKDTEAEQHSDLWEGALNPDMHPYAELLHEAEGHLLRNTGEDTKLALAKLGEAISRMPTEARAYLMRGRIYLSQRNWPACADDLGAADDRSKDTDATIATRLRIDLGVCQARAGRFADAERTLIRAGSNAPAYRGEQGMRLGEVRIALGKLDEAIDALTAALEFGDIQHQLTRWLLTAAYDRARRPTEASEQADLARRMDPQRTYIEAPLLPHLGLGDRQYLLGVAYRYATPKPELALLYFRQFIKLSPESPWRRRAEEHVRDLSNLKFPAKETITTTGSATTTTDDMRTALDKSMKPVRQCVASLPATVFQVVITRVGPRSPEQGRDHPMYRVPPPSIKVAQLPNVGDRISDLDSMKAADCIEKEANKVRMPPPKERDTYYTMTFLVVAP